MAGFFGSEISLEDFFSIYWQKKPFFIKKAFKSLKNPLATGYIKELARGHHIDSRLVIEKGGEYPWQVKHGPLDEDDFEHLKTSKCSLLVHNLDSLSVAVKKIHEQFTFLPSWRLDDIMVSLSSKGGGVGPHVDNYDVFLIQTRGAKTWHISESTLEDPEYLEDLDLSILKKFKGKMTFEAEPGDMLYLPPRYGHHGIARESECTTYSVGLRAPSYRDIISGYLEYVFSIIPEERFYTDADLDIFQQHGIIDHRALYKITEIIHNIPLSEEFIARWFGRYISESAWHFTEPGEPQLTLKQFTSQLLNKKRVLSKNLAIRFLYLEIQNSTYLFANSEEIYIEAGAKNLARHLANDTWLSQATVLQNLDEPAACNLLYQLYQGGFLDLVYDFRVERTDWQGAKMASQQIRNSVFIEEQKVPKDMEYDGDDDTCHHFLLFDQQKPAGTARLKVKGREAKLERMAVLPEYRGHGGGKQLLSFILNECKEMLLKSVYLHAQEQACEFYSQAGFEAEGEPFQEASISHIKMRLNL